MAVPENVHKFLILLNGDDGKVMMSGRRDAWKKGKDVKKEDVGGRDCGIPGRPLSSPV